MSPGLRSRSADFVRALTIACAVATVLTRPNSAGAWTEYTLHSFCTKMRCADGYLPNGVFVNASGRLIGTDATAGEHGQGVLFWMAPRRHHKIWTFRVRYQFCSDITGNCADGGQPTGELIADVKGRLYGVTRFPAAHSSGTVFRFTPGRPGGGYEVLYSFCNLTSCPGGYSPAKGLTYAGEAAGVPWDGVSPLFGTTDGGGEFGGGAIYEITPRHSNFAEEAVYSFQSHHQVNGLISDAAGNLYGVTTNGGTHDSGQLFELEHGTWNFKVLHDFCSAGGCGDGQYPIGRLAIDAMGHLFGVTAWGGRFQETGVAYEFAPETQQYTVIYPFCSADPFDGCSDGAYPQAGMTIGPDGDLFGTTWSGGGSDNSGIVFRLHFDGQWSETVVHAFCRTGGCNEGSGLMTPLSFDGAGNIFGTMQYGGGKQYGTVFELTP